MHKPSPLGRRKIPRESQPPCMLHNPSYDFNDELLALGATYWVRLVERYLARV